MRPHSFAAFALLVTTVAAFGQGGDKEYIIAVSVDSTDIRIQQIMPELRDEAAKTIEQAAKNVHAIVLVGSSSTPTEQARQNSANYLLTINLSLLSQVAFPSRGGLGNGPTTTADVPTIGGVPSGIAHSRCEDLLNKAFAFSYKITSLSREKIKLQGSHTMAETEYPLGPEANCLAKFSTRAVRVCASDAVKGLKSKKRI